MHQQQDQLHSQDKILILKILVYKISLKCIVSSEIFWLKKNLKNLFKQLNDWNLSEKHIAIEVVFFVVLCLLSSL